MGKQRERRLLLVVDNNDWKHWTTVMNIEPIEGRDEEKRRVHRPRPGHADLNGGLKYNLNDLRNVWSAPAPVRRQLVWPWCGCPSISGSIRHQSGRTSHSDRRNRSTG